MAKKAIGRMINVDISLSAKVAKLTPEALALFCLLIPHYNSHGKMLANPHLVKGLVCPLVDWLPPAKVEACLKEITTKTSVKFWVDKKGLHYLQCLNWKDHQSLREDRLGPDHLPEYSRSSPGVNPETPAKGKGSRREVEVEVEEEGGLPRSPRSVFVPPSVEEVAAYAQQRNSNLDPLGFVDFYTCKGWMVGKNKMKDWKAAWRNWERRDRDSGKKQRTLAGGLVL